MQLSDLFAYALATYSSALSEQFLNWEHCFFSSQAAGALQPAHGACPLFASSSVLHTKGAFPLPALRYVVSFLKSSLAANQICRKCWLGS